MLPATAAVVVAWREPEITLQAISSLGAMQPAVDTLVCVVQEWGADDVVRLSDQLGPSGVVLAIDDNLGFSEAANQGVDAALAAGAEWVLLVNNDATVTPDCLERCLLEASRHERAAVIGPAVVFADKPWRVWYAGGKQSRHFAFTTHPGLHNNAGNLPPTGPTQYVPGCCALISARAWQDVGKYRTDFFLYYEDADWCFRARAKGWQCWYLAEVLCHHAVSVSAGKRGSTGLTETSAYYLARNPLRWALGTAERRLRTTRAIGVLGIWGAYNAGRLLKSGSLRAGRAYLAGTRDAFAGRMGRRPS
ncbi:MAG: glycosyltransferase [Acidimicrobiales bacterium]